MDLSQLGSQLGSPHLLVSENLPLHRGIDSVVGDTGLFRQSFDPRIAYTLGTGNALWLHFRVQADATPSPTGWMLALPKPYIDRVEFYQKDARGAWQMQAAGDRVAHAQWPLRSLSPQFALPVMAAGTHDFYLKIHNEIPLHFSVQLQRTDAANTRIQHTFLLGGILLGVSALMLAFSGMLAANAGYREFLWYALFVGLSCFATATYMGLSTYALWPHSAAWANQANYWLIMVATTAQLQFCRTIFLPSAERSWWRTSTSIALVAAISAIGLFFYYDRIVPKLGLYFFVVYACTALAIALVVRALCQGNSTAWLWLVAYTPLIISVGLASLDSAGFAINGVPFDTPVYALIFEVAVLLVALHLHAKSKQAQQVRRSLLDSIDPHTGFIPSRSFAATAQSIWDAAQQSKRPVAVAFVEATSNAPLSQQPVVRLLRTVARDSDTVAHVDKNLYAILMPEQHLGTDLTARLARLVALGHMAVKDLAVSSAVQFRIVASGSAAFAGTWSQIDTSLRNKLNDPKGWSRKSIRYVRLRSAEDSQPESGLASLSQLSDMWQTATDESARLDALRPQH